MADSEDFVQRLIIDTGQSTDVVVRLRKEIEQLETAQRGCNLRFKEGDLTEQEFVEHGDDLIRALREKKDLLDRLGESLDTGGGGGGGGRGFGQGMLQASYAVQDFTSQLGTQGLGGALAAIQNNIPGILMGLGVSGGLAGALSLVSVAAGALVPIFEKLFGAETAENIKKRAEEIKKLADEAKELTTPEKGDAEKQFAAETKRLAGQGQNLVGLAAAAIGASGLGAQATDQETQMIAGQAAVARMSGSGPAKAELARLQDALNDRITAANVKMANDQVALAARPGPEGKAARVFLKGLADRNPGAFPPQFAEFMRDIEETPEQARAAEEAIEAADPDAQFMARHKANLARGKDLNAAARERNRKADEEFNAGVRAMDDALAVAREREQERKANEREDAKDVREAAAKERKEAAEAKRHARESTPMAIQRRREAEIENQVQGGMNQMGVFGDEQFLSSVRRKAVNSVEMGAGLAAAVQDAVMRTAAETQMKIERDFQNRMRQMSQSRIGY